MDQDHQNKPLQSVSATEPHRLPDFQKSDGVDQAIESVPAFRNWKVVVPSLIVLIGVAVAAWYWYVGRRDFVSTDDAFIDADRATISSKILGRIDTLMANEGDTVSAGQVLVRLDPRDLTAQYEQAQASLILAKESVKLAKVGVEKAKQDLNRGKAQYQDKVIPAEQYDHALKSLEEAQARHTIAVAQVGSAEAQVNVISALLQNCIVQAGIHGTISKRWTLPGDVVQAGQPIFTIFNLDSVWATAYFEETKLTELHANDPVGIVVDAYEGHTWHGRVFQIGSNTASQFSLIPPNNASGNFTKVTQRVPVKILIERSPGNGDHSNDRLLPGMSVEVRVKVR